jgi:Fascin domain
MTTITLRAKSGHYLCAESGGGTYVVCDRADAGPWETWTVHAEDDGTYSLQAHNGQYLTAELDGSVAVRASQSGEWERFLLQIRDVGVAFMSAHGTFLQAPQGGGTPEHVRCVGDDPNLPGEWEFFVSSEPFWLPPAPTNLNLLHGEMTRDGRVLGDDTGPRIIMACHFMEGFSAFCHNKSIGALDVRTQLEIIAEEYGAVRNLDVLGYWDENRPGDSDIWVAWGGREVTPISFVANSGKTIPPTPNYWDRKREYVTLLHELGLKILDDRGDMNSWTNGQKLEHMRLNGEFYNSLPFGKEVLLGLFAINEAWQNGGDDKYLLEDMINAFKEGAGWLPAICGLSAPGGNSDPDALAKTDPPMTSWESEMPESFLYWSTDPATVLTVHGNRGDHTHIIEHYWCYGYDETMRDSGKVAFNTEPVGGGDGVSVGQVNDPELLCGLTVGALIGGQPWTFMSGSGVFWDEPIETMPGFSEVARLPTFLPNDIASWPIVCHSGTRFAGVRILAAVDPTRADHAIAEDGRFAIIVHTQEQAGNALPCERACAEFRVINLLTGEIEREGPMRVGETYAHAGLARLVVGRLEGSEAAATMTAWGVATAPDKPKRRGGRLLRVLWALGGRGWSA